MGDAQQEGERRGGITSLPADLLRAILQRVVEGYAIFPPALVCRDWNEAIASLTISVDAMNRIRDGLEGKDFCDAMVALGKVESLKLNCSSIKGLAAAMGSSSDTRWCLNLKRLKLSEMEQDLCNSAAAGTAFSSTTSASLSPRHFRRSPLPVWLSQMTNLSRLELARFSLESLSSQTMGGLPSSLQELHLSTMNGHDMPAGFRISADRIGNLPNLRVLKLIKVNAIGSLPDSIGNLTQLEELVIKGCRVLYSLPQSLNNLTNLRILRFGGCTDLYFPLDFLDGPHQFKSLQVCKVMPAKARWDDDRPFQYLSCHGPPPSMGTCSALRVLHLSSDRMTTLGFSLGALTNLQKLRLDCPELETLPQDVNQLVALRELAVFSNKLTHLLCELTNPNLETLVLACPLLESLPEVWGPSLKHLLVGGTEAHEVPGCQLEALPAGISSLVNLEMLAVASSSLRSLPVEAASHLTSLTVARFYFWKGCRDTMEGFLCALPALRSLDFMSADFGALPRLLRPLPQLQDLDLGAFSRVYRGSRAAPAQRWESIHCLRSSRLSHGSCGSMVAAPEEGELDASRFEGLNSLKDLTIHLPYLLKLPHLGSLRSLVRLYLQLDACLELPDSIGDLRSLEELELRQLRITSLPSSVCNLTSLLSLHIDGLSRLLEFKPCATWTRLKTLSIVNCCGLSSNAPGSTWDLPSLEKLSMSCCLLHPCSPDLGACQKLSSLNFNCGESTRPHRVCSLPKSLSRLSSLASIQIKRGDCIAELPGFLASMTQLRQLTVGGINLFYKRVPGAAPPSDDDIEYQLLHYPLPSGLVHTPCVDTDVKEQVQRLISHFAAMTTFQYYRLPSNPCLFPQLECLILLTYRGRTLSPALGAFKNLKTLRIRYCPNLESLPPEISALQQLKELEITGCGNLSLPVELTTLQELETLTIKEIRDQESIPLLSVFPKLQNAVIE